MRGGNEIGIRFIEPDVARVANAEELNIHTAERTNQLIIAAAFFPRIGGHPVRDMRMVRPDIDVAKQVFPHVIRVTLVVLRRKAAVLIEIH